MLSLAVLLPRVALTRYDDHGEPAYTARERLLLALRRLDWASRAEINVALECDWDDNVSQALSRLIRSGHVERRGSTPRLYRLVASAFTPRGKPDWQCSRCTRPRIINRRQCELCRAANAANQRRHAARKAS